MPRRTFIRLFAGILGAVALAGAQLLAPASADAVAARVLYYDASRAAEFVDAVNQGARNWNASVSNVRLLPVPAGRRANITITADNGWPHAVVDSLGNGRIVMGREAVELGHHKPRIAAHEFGHLLGLPDRRTGRCGDLMSGSSAPASCRNAFPNTREAREVDADFRGASAVAPATADRPLVYVDY